jgi:hypothetical protein
VTLCARDTRYVNTEEARRKRETETEEKEEEEEEEEGTREYCYIEVYERAKERESYC